MKDLYESTARVEASDLDGRGRSKGPSCILLRVGATKIGKIELVHDGKHTVKMSWSVENGGHRQSQSVGLGGFKTENGVTLLCFRCPVCRKLRKRLFLINASGKEFSFICKDCCGRLEPQTAPTPSYSSASSGPWPR